MCLVRRGWALWAVLLLVLAALPSTGCGGADFRLQMAPTGTDEAASDDVEQPGLRLVPQFGHVSSPFRYAFSPDGRLLVSDDIGESTMLLWDVATGSLLRRLQRKGDAGASIAISFTPDSRQVLQVTQHDMRRFNVANGELIDTKPWELPYVAFAAAFTSDARFFVMSGGNGPGKLIEVATMSVAKTFPQSNAFASAAAISDDAKRAAIIHGDGSLELIDLTTGAQIRSTALGHGPTIARVAVSPDGKRVLTTVMRQTSKLVDVDSGNVIREIGSGKMGGLSCQFSRDGKLVITQGNVFDVESGQPVRMAEINPLTRTLAEAFTPDGKHVVEGLFQSNGLPSSSFRVADVRSGEPISTFRGDAYRAASAIVPGGRRALTASGLGSFELWDLETGTLIRNFDSKVRTGVTALAVSPDGRLAVSGGLGGYTGPDGKTVVIPTLGVWDLETGELVRNLGTEGWVVQSVAFSPDGKRVVVGGHTRVEATKQDYILQLWDVESGTLVRPFVGHAAAPGMIGMTISSVEFSADGARVLSVGNDSMRLWDVASGNCVKVMNGSMTTKATFKAAILPDQKRAIVTTLYGWGIWDLSSGASLRTVERSHWAFTPASLAVSADSKRALIGSSDGRLELWDLDAGKLVTLLKGHIQSVEGAAFTADGLRAISTSHDGTLRMWKLDTGDSITMVADGPEWVTYSKDGYFDASRNGGSLVAAVDGTRVFRIDQLAARNNRPDLLLQKVGLGSPELIAHYQARHERRLKQLGLDEAKLSNALQNAPQARISDAKQDGKFVEITIELSASAADLARYNIYANDIPLFGATGKETKGKTQQIKERVELTAGNNKLEVSAFDAAGAESLRDFRDVVYKEKAPGDLFYVGFGVSKYQNPALNLSYAHKDVMDLGAVLGAIKGSFKEVHATTFVNEQVTPDAIRKAKDLFAKAKVDDTVVVFVAGHGTHARDAAADYLYVTYNTDVHKLRETAASFDLIENLFQGIAPRRKLLLLDTCESGDRDEIEESQITKGTAGQRGLHTRSIRALVLTDDAKAAAPAPAKPRPFLLNRERYIYNDITRRTGSVVFSSSRGSEVSFELDELQNGVFTENLMLALTTNDADANHDGSVSTDELRGYVGGAVSKMTNGYQHPTIDRDNPDAHVGLPVAPSARAIVDRPLR